MLSAAIISPSICQQVSFAVCSTSTSRATIESSCGFQWMLSPLRKSSRHGPIAAASASFRNREASFAVILNRAPSRRLNSSTSVRSCACSAEITPSANGLMMSATRTRPSGGMLNRRTRAKGRRSSVDRKARTRPSFIECQTDEQCLRLAPPRQSNDHSAKHSPVVHDGNPASRRCSE